MTRPASILLAVLILAVSFIMGGQSAQHTAMRACIWQATRFLLRQVGIH